MRSAREMSRLADVFLAGGTEGRFYAQDLRRAASVSHRRLADMLAQMRDLGWVDREFDASTSDGRPYYMLTEAGRRELA
ncbi:helix-turn-helix transcriptional regulator [Amycolatopsis sp. EV170708-02-1]|uniref:helix-turn-helix transcriptional regulator n=1 Tax=Amycolatopsis sp. EV170708-02-1 TaxID=2919322 RepID=UPI001F0B9F34|nr:helix-turn-helix transcriptional regulator [Amycolatopsis sp. EV170708-02-1]UMP05571.1 PadR family transcriptional regulator [Amycolatopsis sp. EV170708-02-1]